jgi:hypothetical protein
MVLWRRHLRAPRQRSPVSLSGNGGGTGGCSPNARVCGDVLSAGSRAMARGFDALGVGILGGMGDG